MSDNIEDIVRGVHGLIWLKPLINQITFDGLGF